jgi:hypothetical protein
MGLLPHVSISVYEHITSPNIPHEHIHTTIHAVLDVALFRKGTQCHNGGRVSHLANESRALKAIQIRHLS